MNSRYAQRFAQLGMRREKAFIPFTLLGWPDRDLSLEIIKLMIDSGASALELGWAFSDPIADGRVIQAAAFETLACGFKVENALELVGDVRKFNAEIPIGLLVYYNMVLAQGVEAFFRAACDVGIDGVLIADLPPENIQEVAPAATKYGIDLIFVVSPLTNEQRLKMILEHAGGFLYIVSRLGITGTSGGYDKELPDVIARVRRQSNLPMCVGFGISTPEQARSMIDIGADGVITGSRVIEIVDRAREQGDPLSALKAYLTSMVGAVSSVGRV